jgi:hypothetical protein
MYLHAILEFEIHNNQIKLDLLNQNILLLPWDLFLEIGLFDLSSL